MRKILLALALLLAACQAAAPEATLPIAPLQSVQAPTLHAIETNTTAPTLTTIPTKPPTAYFTVAVIVDTASEPVSREQAEAVIGEADGILQYLTKFGIQMTDFVEDSSGASIDAMVNNYMQAAVELPNGIVVFSFGDGGQAKLYGGYAREMTAPSGFKNSFVAPLYGDNQMYVAVVHFGHKYAACGYAGADTIQSAVSSKGECRGVDGVSCVEHNGYSTCPDTIDDLYASTLTYFAASSVVHEIMHSFGEHGVDDHFGTAKCIEIMDLPSSVFDELERSQKFNSMCQYVYENFKASYQPSQ